MNAKKQQALASITKAMKEMFKARQQFAKAALECRVAGIDDSACQMDQIYITLEQLDRDYTQYLMRKAASRLPCDS